MPTVGKTNQIAPGQLLRVDLFGVAVAIANVDGNFYAISDTCSHGSCSLSQGELNGKVLICKVDGSQFDLISGNVLAGPATKRLRTYRIQAKGDELSI